MNYVPKNINCDKIGKNQNWNLLKGIENHKKDQNSFRIENLGKLKILKKSIVFKIEEKKNENKGNW